MPKSALTVEEEAWNAYPYTKTRLVDELVIESLEKWQYPYVQLECILSIASESQLILMQTFHPNGKYESSSHYTSASRTIGQPK